VIDDLLNEDNDLNDTNDDSDANDVTEFAMIDTSANQPTTSAKAYFA
jgi:hypothetical protein